MHRLSEAQVLAAAAALRDFSLDEIAARCDAEPPTIVEILTSVEPSVKRVDRDNRPRWHVVDLAALRGSLRARRLGAGAANLATMRHADTELRAVRLRHAEEMLARCGAEASAQRRRAMVSAAVNHLRQVLAGTLPDEPPWWTVELSGDSLERELRHHPEQSTAQRLSLDLAVARLAVGNAAGRTVPTSDLIDTVVHIRRQVKALADERLNAVVRGFVELVTAQLAPVTAPAVDRLVVAVARRRVRAKVGDDSDLAMGELEPLVRVLGSAPDRSLVQDLHKNIKQLPDGRDVVVVYADLLPLLPIQYRWQQIGEPLPGALIKLVTDPRVSEYLSLCAHVLEADLARSPFGSDRALIGQAAHVFQRLAEEAARLDGGVVLRGNRTRSELLTLALPTVWPPPAAAPGSSDRCR